MPTILSDYLVEFSVVVQQGTISQAAEQLNMSQSTLTRHLATLESTLGAKLMERNAAGVHLTDEGRFVYDAALQVVFLGDDLVRRLQEWGNGAGSQFAHVVIGGLSELKATSRAFETACVRLSAQGYDVSLQYLPPQTPLSFEAALERREVDIVLAFAALAQRIDCVAGMRQEELISVPAVAIMERTHPLARATSLSLHDIKDTTFARVAGMKDNVGAVWDEFARQCEAEGFSPLYHTLSYQNTPLYDLIGHESIIVQMDDGPYARVAREQGYAVTPIMGLSLQVVAIMRDDDHAALHLVEETKSFL